MDPYWYSEHYFWTGVTPEIWEHVRIHLPRPLPRPRRRRDRKGGRPRASDRLAFGAILWIARSGRQWRQLPPEFGSARTALRRLASWSRGPRLEWMFRAYLAAVDDREVLSWAETFHANRCRRWSLWRDQLESIYRYDDRARRLSFGPSGSGL